MTTMDTTDVVVVGAGLMGSAAARSLAERGHRVVVVERDVAASARGASHGSARIFRYAYPDPFYAGLVPASRRLYTELETRLGRQLITPTGALDFGSIRNPEALAPVLAEVGVEHELLTPERARDRWPGIAVDTPVLYHEAAGVIDAESTVLGQLELATAAGAECLEHWEAVSVRRGQLGWTVTSAGGAQIRAAQVVLAVGGWMKSVLAGADLPSSFTGRIPEPLVTQEYAYHFPYADEAAVGEPAPGERTAWPAFIEKSPEIFTYSLPGGRDAGFRGQKLAEYHAGLTIEDASAQTGLMSDENRVRVVDYVKRRLPGLVPEPYAETTCLFTMLPNEDFLVDAADGLILAQPCSGHGAKFAPLIGELVADQADGRDGVPRFAAGAHLYTEATA